MELICAKYNAPELRIFPNGRIDANNAAEAEKAILAAVEENPTEDVLLDAENLEYISSAGLRIVLRLRKQKPKLKVVNASAEVYEIFEITGFSEMLPVEKAYRKMSVDGCEIIGRGAKGTVYRINEDTIIKVYHDADCLPDIQRERELARKAFVLGVPTAISYDIVRVGDSFGSVFELLNAKSYSKLLAAHPENISEYASDFAKLLKTIHTTAVKPEDMPDGRDRVRNWLNTDKQYLAPEDFAALSALVEALPEQMTMLHCDYHTNNIMKQNGETLLIDMDTLAHGHPIIELANIYICYCGFAEVVPDNTETFLGIATEQGRRFWEAFLPLYLETEDAAKLREVEQKAMLLSYARLLHYETRHPKKPEYAEKAKTLCPKRIHELLQEIRSLEF